MNFLEQILNTKDCTAEQDLQDIQNAKTWAVLAYLGVLCFLPLVAVPNSEYGRFHANQGLLLFLFSLVTGALNRILDKLVGWIPLVGGLAVSIVSGLLGLAAVCMMVLGIYNAATGKAKELPLIGSIRLLK